MPNYSYGCDNCHTSFELFFYIKDYDPSPKCIGCGKIAHRLYSVDVLTQSASVKKGDSELKTIGDLARRNSDRLSEDEKTHLYQKHNSYKFEDSKKELPKGMNRVKKEPKIKWPGSTKPKRRNIKK